MTCRRIISGVLLQAVVRIVHRSPCEHLDEAAEVAVRLEDTDVLAVGTEEVLTRSELRSDSYTDSLVSYC